MKILKAVMIAVVLLMSPAYAFSANLGYMRISLVEGDVQVKTPDSEEWGIASINGPLMEGDQIWVPQGGRVELQLNWGSYIRLDQNSALQILSMDKDASQFYLSQGHAYIYSDAAGGRVIQVDTPDASTRAFNKAIFRVDMSEEYQYTEVAVYKGYVETENQLGKTRIDAGQMLSVGQNTNGEIAPMGPPDDWETWNKTRNDRIFARRGSSSRYLPAELSAYSYDFDNSGKWVQVPDYGNVWTPTVVVGASWSPYRDGRWIWRGDDYVWVAYEPWGWAPYHYGRWSFGVNIGWFWVPPVRGDVYWSPGYVGWVRTADYVAWVPLAPGETYYGRGNYGRHSVNIANVNINQVNITNVYRNANINNGVTVVNRNTFATVSPRLADVNHDVIRRQIFTRNNFSVGAPAIRPTRESYFMSPRQAPSAKHPPQTVRNLQVTQLKQSRPFIKDPGKSVINPGARPQTLPVNTATTRRTPGKEKPVIQTIPGAPAPKMEFQPAGRKPITPESGFAPKKEIKPMERKAVPERAPAPRKEYKPVERKAVPESAPAPRKEYKPVERKAVPESAPAPRKEYKPVERKAVPESAPAPRKEYKPEERKVVPESAPAPRKEYKPVERKVVPESAPAPRKEIKPMERKVVPESAPAPKKEFKPAEKKEVTPQGAPPPRGEKPQVKPEKKPDEKKPAESTQKDQRKQENEPRQRSGD